MAEKIKLLEASLEMGNPNDNESGKRTRGALMNRGI
jgi:hypothetical protein